MGIMKLKTTDHRSNKERQDEEKLCHDIPICQQGFEKGTKNQRQL